MIGKLAGKIDSLQDGVLILDVGGVGYLVHASRRTLGRIGAAGEYASLLIDTWVREESITLYGFADGEEQQWFRLLTSVQGVGAKVGLAILSACPPEKIALAIAAQDKTALTQADGVGPKLAVRIVTELKDKPLVSAPFAATKTSPNAPESVPEQGLIQDALSALVNLGYNRTDAYAALLRAQEKGADNLQALIRTGLRELSGG